MKRKSLLMMCLICLVIIISMVLFVYKPEGTGNTIEEAMIKSGRIPLKIIGVEKAKGGALVFFIKNSLDIKKADAACGFVKRTIWGWKWVSGGEHGSIDFYSSNKGFSKQYFPKTEGTPFPLYFGVVTNPEIKHMYVLDKNRNLEADATIINNDYINMWYVYMDKLKGKDFQIYTLAKNYKILSCTEDHIFTGPNTKAAQSIGTLNSKDIDAAMVKKIQSTNLTSKNIKILDKKTFTNLNVVLFTYDFAKEHYIGLSYFEVKGDKVENFSGLGNAQLINKEHPIATLTRCDTDRNITNMIVYGEVFDRNIKYVKVYYADGVNKLDKVQNNGYIVIRQGKKDVWPKEYDFLDVNNNPVIVEKLWKEISNTTGPIYNTKVQKQLLNKVSKLMNYGTININTLFCSYKYKTRFIEKDRNLLFIPDNNSNVVNIARKGTIVKVLYSAVINNKRNNKDLWLLVQIPVFDTPMDSIGWLRESDTVQYNKAKIKNVLREVYTKAGGRGEIEKREGNKVFIMYPGGDYSWVDEKDIIYPEIQ